jgi:hypothetical protein
MAKKIGVILATIFLLGSFGDTIVNAQPVLKLGWSGAGVGADLLKLIDRTSLWRKHGVDVRPIYLTSGNLMAQTL